MAGCCICINLLWYVVVFVALRTQPLWRDMLSVKWFQSSHEASYYVVLYFKLETSWTLLAFPIFVPYIWNWVLNCSFQLCSGMDCMVNQMSWSHFFIYDDVLSSLNLSPSWPDILNVIILKCFFWVVIFSYFVLSSFVHKFLNYILKWRLPEIFLQFRTHKVIYRRYAGLFFSLCVDITDNELAYLECIHLFVEILDHFFSNVCELDLVFNFHKVCLCYDFSSSLFW